MNREQKAAAIAVIAGSIQESQAVFAVDYRGISVPQAAELRTRLRDADTRFQVVKNTLTERAADQAGVSTLKELLTGPTALVYVRGDAAAAAKTLRDFGRQNDLLPFKGGVMGDQALAPEQVLAIAALPSREVLYAQLVGVTASPLTGLVRGLGALVGGLAVALGQIREKKESGELPAGEPPAAAAAPVAGEGGDAATATPTAETPQDPPEDPDAGPASSPDEPQPDQAEGEDEDEPAVVPTD